MVICGFAGYTTFGLPLIVPEAPPKEEKLGGNLTMDQYIAVGDKIFHGKGTCTLCHSPVGGRAPLLEAVAGKVPERLKDPRYKGKAKTAEEYIHESMIQPSAFVVEGFGKKGTNDTESPMPQIDKGSIGLSAVEINAVIAYLLSIGGVEVTVPLPTGDAGVKPAGDDKKAEVKPAATAEEAFKKYDCLACHMAPGAAEGGDVGPNLKELAKVAGSRKKGMSAKQYIAESITNPNAYVVKGFDPDTMPGDFAAKMTVSELDLLVDALAGKK